MPRRASSDKVLHRKTFTITNNPKYDGYQIGLRKMVNKFFDKKRATVTNKSATTHEGIGIKSESQQLAGQFNKPFSRQFENRKVYPPFKDNIWECWSSRYEINK